MLSQKKLKSALQSGDDSGFTAILAEDPSLLGHRDNEGATLLHLSARHNQNDMAKYLLDQGLDPNILTSQNRSARHDSFECGAPEISQLLLGHGANIDINYAAAVGDLATMKRLADENAQLVFDQSTGISVLEWAVFGDSDVSVYFLHEHGIDLNFQDTEYQSTALMTAAQYNHCRAARAILELGGDPNLTSSEGYTALHFAATMRYAHDTTHIAALLLAYNAEVNIRGREQLTPLGVLERMHTSQPDSNRNFNGLQALLKIHDGLT